MKRVFIILLGIFLGFISLETILRTYYWLGDRQFLNLYPSRTTIKWRDDSLVGRRLLPKQSGWFVSNTGEYFTWIDVNSTGWRDSEHTLEKSENTYRILIIGDSFVENFQVPLEETFFKRLEENLNQKLADRRTEIVAIGLGDSGTAQQYLILKTLGLAYRPDLIIQFFFTGNDVKNNSPELMANPYRSYFKLVDGHLELQPFVTRTSIPQYKATSFLKDNVRILEFLLDLKGELLGQTKPDDYPEDYHVYDKEYSHKYEEAWRVTEALILESRRLAKEHGADYILVSLANNEQLHKDVWEEVENKYPALRNANLDLEKPDKILRQFCEEEEIKCLPMLPYFRKFRSSNPEVRTHYKFDGHWNETGTGLVASILEQYLEDYLK